MHILKRILSSRRRIAVGVAGGLLWLVASTASGADACKLEGVELPVTLINSRAIATVQIDGTPVPLMVDTGAFFSMLTEATARRLRLRLRPLPEGMKVRGLTGDVPAQMTTVPKLGLPVGELPHVDFIVGGNDMAAGDEAMGILGRNLFAYTDTEYDLAHGMIRLVLRQGDCSQTNLAYWAGDKPVNELPLLRDASSRTPAIQAEAQLDGHKLTVLFDTGASNSMVALSSARRAGVDEAAMKPAGVRHGAGRGEARSWIAPFKSFELGDEEMRNNLLLVEDIDAYDQDMLLGMDFFLSHHLYVDRTGRRMFMTYNGGPVFALNRAATPAADSVANGAARNAANSDPDSAPNSAAASAVSNAASTPGADAPIDAPVDVAGYLRRGAASAARGDFAHALADIDRACASSPSSADCFTRRGVVHESLRQPAAALQDFDQALSLDPAQAEARLHRVGLRLALRDRIAALADLRTLDETLSPQSSWRRLMASIYLTLDEPASALAQWNPWIAVHPHEVDLDRDLNGRCWPRMMLGVELKQALDDCDEAVDRQPDKAAYLDSRGWVHLRRGEWREARSDFEHALTLHADGAWTLYGRGLVRIHLGDPAGQDDLVTARQRKPTIDTEVDRLGLSR